MLLANEQPPRPVTGMGEKEGTAEGEPPECSDEVDRGKRSLRRGTVLLSRRSGWSRGGVIGLGARCKKTGEAHDGGGNDDEV